MNIILQLLSIEKSKKSLKINGSRKNIGQIATRKTSNPKN
jgi:hypothetical protein